MELTRPFIRLPLRFDAGRLAEEIAALPSGAWMLHPSGQPGNSAVALIARGGEDNDDFTGAMAATRHLAASRYHRQVMASFGEVLARSRLMKLAAGCEVGLHVDFNYHWYTRVRMHVPVVTNPGVRFHCGDQTVHMEPGECWLFDNWRPHNVVNDGDADRVHLVIDLAGSSRFWQQVRRVAELDPETDRSTLERMTTEIPYRPDRDPDVPTERFNASPVMAPGEVEGLVRELVADFGGNGANDPEMVRRYTRLLTDFARDWREAWHRHGMEPSGTPHYRRLIERTIAALDPDRRALVTASNGVGVNAVIVQRILRPALVEHAENPAA